MVKFYDYLLIAKEEPRAFFDAFDLTLFKSWLNEVVQAFERPVNFGFYPFFNGGFFILF